jgi:hypothetical protein
MGQAEPGSPESDARGEQIHGRSLLGAVLLAVLVAAMWISGSLRGPTGLAPGLLFVLYFVVGAYEPWRGRIPFYDRLLAVPVLIYGVSLLRADGASLLGLLFVVVGVLGIAQVLRDWYVGPEGPDAATE